MWKYSCVRMHFVLHLTIFLMGGRFPRLPHTRTCVPIPYSLPPPVNAFDTASIDVRCLVTAGAGCSTRSPFADLLFGSI